MSDEKPGKKVADQYDRGYDYTTYWDNRDYEHESEQAAIRSLLEGRHFDSAVDIGGGFGRLCLLLRKYADHVTLAEPSQSQLDAADKVLAGTDIVKLRTQADAIDLPDASQDLLTMVRVMHHIPEPTKEFGEIARVLKPGATALIEVANYGHFKNRRRFKKEGKPLPTEPVSIRTVKADEPDAIAFVNHNIDTVVGQLDAVGLHLVRKLSVSNLRSEKLKKTLPTGLLVAVEKRLQKRLAKNDFGPSIFLELRKA
ncbi:hypothetical protein ASD11_15415 [Aeromicrobium sp. Root495]|uniref:class I SAM-dependent methyltransferase n=1 Tax=Aeromicrobium sp. Root495 TaxID=1736550 RepID=UPI0006FDBFA3|nr:class I SAM-dependent methyltransferase [Aeromicrobium sp. Root495]KQY55882.1 hypothetical protein ASD11_15415 [Aeromicrobium sp. Root495]